MEQIMLVKVLLHIELKELNIFYVIIKSFGKMFCKDFRVRSINSGKYILWLHSISLAEDDC